MNKKIIITIVFALITMAGQAQVKTGLDLCLRDEGEQDGDDGLLVHIRFLFVVTLYYIYDVFAEILRSGHSFHAQLVVTSVNDVAR